MLDVQSRMLRRMGYVDVSCASSAVEALQIINNACSVIDVVICDINMPDVDGIEFLKRLDKTGFRGNIILLSGEGARIIHSVQQLLSGGRLLVLGAVQKPVDRHSLQVLLFRWQPHTPLRVARKTPLVTEAELRSSMSGENWVLHYQPKVNLKSGLLQGVEALIRWIHPVHGLIMPDSFIPLAEDTGLINQLTEWVLRTAINQQVIWRGQGLPLTMSINVSLRNLANPSFSNKLLNLVEAEGAFAEDIILELTESQLMSQGKSSLESLVRLRLKRMGLSIDDFGTGHSSLTQLRDVPFTELKIDKSFVQAAEHNQITRPILEGSIGIAKRLSMTSVAEGVETEEDWIFLRSLGCDLAQGWLIGRAMPSVQMEAWHATWKGRANRLLS